MNLRPRRLITRPSLVATAAVIAGLSASSATAATARSTSVSAASLPATVAPTPTAASPVIPAPSPAPPAPASAAPATLSITGNGSVEIPPDEATLSIEVRSTAATATGARSKANARTDAVLLAITKLGVPRAGIQTSGVSLSRSEVAATRRHPAHKLYGASNDLTVETTTVSLVGPIVDAATRAGADSVDGPDFSFADPSDGLAAATRAALADARSRAADAAAALGYQVVGVQSVAIDPPDEVTPVAEGTLDAQAPAAAARPVPTTVDPGEQEVDATVDVVFVIAPIAG
jgi:uncharacterized protein